jgi:N-formylglutamate deformylase
LKLPLLVSLPHAGLQIPPELKSLNILTQQQIIQDGDEGAAEIYAIRNDVAAFVTTDVARAFVDLNRAEHDRRTDGVVKTHTCWNVPIYRAPLSELLVETLLSEYYRPYHQQLSQLARQAKLGIDCHTMAAVGPPVGPGAGKRRPFVCLSNADGTCSEEWLERMAECFKEAFACAIAVNHPFKGGYIIRSHAHELPWIQIELSRAPFVNNQEKRTRLLGALTQWSQSALTD